MEIYKRPPKRFATRKKEIGTVLEDFTQSRFTPWYFLTRVRFDNPIYSPDIKGEDAHISVREISELKLER